MEKVIQHPALKKAELEIISKITELLKQLEKLQNPNDLRIYG